MKRDKFVPVLGVVFGVFLSVQIVTVAADVAEIFNSTTRYNIIGIKNRNTGEDSEDMSFDSDKFYVILGKKSERVAVNVNKLVDSLVWEMRQFAVDNELDPMELPDFKEGFRVKLVLLAIHGELWLTDGLLHDFATLRRDGDAVVDVKKKTVDLHFAIGFEDLIIDYDYKAKLMNIGPKGGIIGTLKETTMRIDLSYDKATQVASLTKLKITHKGRLDVKFTGTILLDLVANAISDVITTLFTGVIMNIIEDKVRDAIEDALDHHALPL